MFVFAVLLFLIVDVGYKVHAERHHPPPLAHRDPSESYDQEHLKKYDRGCPTAVFIAPGGALEQCP